MEGVPLFSMYTLVLCCVVVISKSVTPSEFNADRLRILEFERSQRLGASISLTPTEQKVNEILLQVKQHEISATRVNGSIFLPSVSFFKTRTLIEKSKVFQIIKRMPKGGALHTHDSSITSIDWLVKDVTYRPHCYMCFKGTQLLFYFFDKPNKECSWTLVKTLRENSGHPDFFDRQLITNISLVISNPEEVDVSVQAVWGRFGKYFKSINGLLNYKPVFYDYFLRALTEFQADNVQYLEIRALLPALYELDGSTHTAEYTLQIYRNVTRQFKLDNPSFIGCNIIQSAIRFFPPNSILASLKQAISFYHKYPDIFRGFDLVGQEGPGHTLQFYLNELLYPQEMQSNNIPFFFHAGETDWEGDQVDLNLVDAILLNTSRIGHGYAIYKHPEVMKLIKQKSIAIEVNPISNQVLKLVGDLRNHGAVNLFANNYPLVVSSDDPAVWDALPLSHDFYMAFMALCGEKDGLEVLKQLAINSIRYSAMSNNEQDAAMRKWNHSWTTFIHEVLRRHILGTLFDFVG